MESEKAQIQQDKKIKKPFVFAKWFWIALIVIFLSWMVILKLFVFK